MVCKEMILDIYYFGGVVVVLKGLIFNHFYFGGCGSFGRNNLGSLYFGRM